MEYYDGIIKMTKIDLEFPYTEKYKAGYVRVNRENRKTLYLVEHGSTRVSSSTAYARYLMAVHLGRFLEDEEHVDHIDNDKTNDDLSNLQILTLLENNRKSAPKKEYVTLECPYCKTNFTRAKNIIGSLYGYNKLAFCSHRCSGFYYSKL